MRPEPLPPALADLERELAGRSVPEPSAGLRDRILSAVSAERRSDSRRFWKLLWSAAAVLVAVNLAMSRVNGYRYESLYPRGAAPAQLAADHSWPVAAAAITQLRPTPDAGSVARRYFEHEEE